MAATNRGIEPIFITEWMKGEMPNLRSVVFDQARILRADPRTRPKIIFRGPEGNREIALMRLADKNEFEGKLGLTFTKGAHAAYYSKDHNVI